MNPIITSAQNPAIKQLAKLLTAAKHRREHHATVLEGVHLLDAYLQTGAVPQKVWVPQPRLAHADVQAVCARLPENRIVVVQQGILSKISQLSQADDVMTLIDLPDSGCLKPAGDCVVLENVQDAGNIGTILRSAAAAGVWQVVLGKGCADVWSPKVLRSGMGAHFLLKIQERVDLAAWQAQYRGQVLATALQAERNVSLYDKCLNLNEETAWLFGNEGQGVSAARLAQADWTVRIPMLGATESLNVAMAATVCLFEQMRRRLPES